MTETLPGHKGRVNCLSFIERGHYTIRKIKNIKLIISKGSEDKLEDVALISGSADYTAKVWKKDNTGKVLVIKKRALVSYTYKDL